MKLEDHLSFTVFCLLLHNGGEHRVLTTGMALFWTSVVRCKTLDFFDKNRDLILNFRPFFCNFEK